MGQACQEGIDLLAWLEVDQLSGELAHSGGDFIQLRLGQLLVRLGTLQACEAVTNLQLETPIGRFSHAGAYLCGDGSEPSQRVIGPGRPCKSCAKHGRYRFPAPLLASHRTAPAGIHAAAAIAASAIKSTPASSHDRCRASSPQIAAESAPPSRTCSVKQLCLVHLIADPEPLPHPSQPRHGKPRMPSARAQHVSRADLPTRSGLLDLGLQPRQPHQPQDRGAPGEPSAQPLRH